MPARQTLPQLWLLTDRRNDAALETALARLPRGSALVFRHYHLPPGERRRRYEALRRLARARRHVVILAGSGAEAKRWRADGHYGAAGGGAGGRKAGGLVIATAHDLRELAQAARNGANAVMLSPVFPTRSHPGGAVLGPLRFRLMAARAQMPVIALGGMGERTARRLGHPRWAAIDGLSTGFRCRHS